MHADSAPEAREPATGTPAPSGLPLAGVRVIDVTMNIAGPYAALILADLGADVLKIERPGGDDARRMVPRHDNGSAYFYAINRNKSALEIDLATQTGQAALAGELRTADVMVTNLRPATLRKLGIAADDVLRAYPQLIYADISAYGTSGTEADRPGYDMVLQARSGIMSINGNAGGAPARVGVSVLDMGSGMWTALGVIAALYERTRTGQGGRVSTSLLEAGAGFMAYDIAAYQLTGQVPQRRGSGHPSFGPYGVFATRQGLLAIGVGSDGIFARLAAAVGGAGWSTDPRFGSNADRMRHAAELRAELEARLAARTAREWVPVLTAADVPADVVADTAGVLADPQLEALGSWVDLTVGGENPRPLRVPAIPLRLNGTRPPLRIPPPEQPATAPARSNGASQPQGTTP
jgi:crotonobetainyl-CoA:carnitine CoA-transferase CaiB-like acyl-CoA transferase